LRDPVEDENVGVARCKSDGLGTRRRHHDWNTRRSQSMARNECFVSDFADGILGPDHAGSAWPRTVCMSHEGNPRAARRQLRGASDCERRLAGTAERRAANRDDAYVPWELEVPDERALGDRRPGLRQNTSERPLIASLLERGGDREHAEGY
jgi:hypothetical protein